jgi:hypothetical protein
MLAATRGDPTAALDDAYIHFQFAKSFARLEPLVYSPGSAPVPGATSLLWPALLAPFYALGFQGSALLWPAWAISFLCLGLLAYETARAGDGLLSREAALAAGAMVLVFAGTAWCAGSGMEVVPFAWLLLRGARRLADWAEGAAPPSARSRWELCALAWAAALMRPEGALIGVLASLALLVYPRGAPRALALLPFFSVFGSSLINWLVTGHAGSTTIEVKWLFAAPHGGFEHALGTTLNNLQHLWGTLLDGEQHSASIVPRGSKLFAWAALPALIAAGFRQQRRARALFVAAVALMLLVPCTYDTFLWNRLRYLWPFAPAWFVGLGALADTLGTLLGRLAPALGNAPALIAGAFTGTLLGYLPAALQDLAESASGIHRQQVSLGRWAKATLPAGSRIGVNDAGAIAYYSERATFDIVGLTTSEEGPHWVAGAGSRFEHYERLGSRELPTHFIVYPEWLGIPQLLGAELTERYVPDSGILGGARMVAYTASYSSLRSAERPRDARGGIVDRLDVADLASETAHGYDSAGASSRSNYVFQDVDRVDGGRAERRLERFDLRLGRGPLIVRVVTDQEVTLRIACSGREIGRLRTGGTGWEELALELPAGVPAGLHRLEIATEPASDDAPSFAALHYWSMAEP